jgi:hypothetical protein
MTVEQQKKRLERELALSLTERERLTRELKTLKEQLGANTMPTWREAPRLVARPRRMRIGLRPMREDENEAIVSRFNRLF